MSFIRSFISPIVAVLMLAGCGDSHDGAPTEQNETLTMGTSADMPPFEFYQADGDQGEITGFDIEVAQAIAKEMGIELKVKDMDFSTLIPALQSGRVDFVMASMTPTPERANNVDFSQSYLELPVAALVIKEASYKNLKDLKGKHIGVQLGSTHEVVVRKLAMQDKSIKITSLNKLGELVQQLISGRVDLVVMELTTASEFAARRDDLHTTPFLSEKVSFAVAFAKGSQWREKIDAAIGRLRQSGEIDHLRDKWFKVN